MDNKTILVRTSKGEDEAHSKTAHLAGDVKRALLMVDGVATFGEISKRAAPSLRSSLDTMFQELERDGFIQDKDKARSHVAPKMSVPPKMSIPPKMPSPLKTGAPHKNQPVDDDAGELDFMSGFSSASPPQSSSAEANKAEADAVARSRQELETAKIKAQQEAAAILLQAEQAAAKLREETARRAKAEAEAAAAAKAKQELEASMLKAKQEAETILLKAEQEAAKLREETARRAKAEEEASRLKAEQEARKLRDELEAAKLRAEQETRLRLEAAAQARLQAEAARLKAEQEAAQMHAELEAAKLRAEQEAQLRLDAAAKIREQAEAARLKAEQEAAQLQAELEAARLRAEQEVSLGLEAAAKAQEQAKAAHLKEEQEAAQMHAELEAAKLRAELEAKVRLEAAAKAHARMKIEEETAREREEMLARAKAEELAKTVSQPEAKGGTFAFDSFQLDGSQSQPMSGASTPPSQPMASGGFAFESFQVDAPPPEQPAKTPPKPQHLPPTEAAAKPASFAFDSFQVNEPSPATEPQKNNKSASKSEDSAPSEEQIKHAEQARFAAEEQARKHAEEHTRKKMAEEHARQQAEAQAKKLADEQAKVWAEAEQRALEAAKANAERALQQTEQTVAEKPPVTPPLVKTSRKPFSFGKLVSFAVKLGVVLLVLLVGAVFAVPYFMPMRDYMPKIEQLLSKSLNQPVHIGYLSGRILPTPRLELGEIYIGEVKQFQAARAQLNFPILSLFDEKKPINSIVMQNVKVSGKGLQNVSLWLQKLAANDHYPVSRMIINQGTLDADAFELTGIEGEIDFNSAGKFTKMDMSANSGKYKLGINTTPEEKLQVAISVRGNALPLLPNWSFDELTAKGELNNNELLLSDFNARILGGTIQGNASINWRSGWRSQGALTAKTITMNQLNVLLDGNVDGSARFKMASVDLAGLTGSATLDGNFSAVGGTINGMDIVETARLRSKDHLPGGRTHFNDFNGAVSFADNAYHFKQIKITTDVLNATAALDIDKRQLSGSLNAKLSIQAGTAPVDLQIGGTLDSPWLRAAR